MILSAIGIRRVFSALVLSLLSFFPVTALPAQNSPYPVNAGPFTINNPPVSKVYDNTALHIVSASYGLNCNPQIALDSTDPDALIKDNNMFDKMSRQCNKGTSCSQLVTEEGMGYNVHSEKEVQDLNPPPAPGCAKELVIDYTCSPTDGTHIARMQDGGTLTIDCTSGQ